MNKKVDAARRFPINDEDDDVSVRRLHGNESPNFNCCATAISISVLKKLKNLMEVSRSPN